MTCRRVPIKSCFIYSNVNKLFRKVARVFLVKQQSHVLRAFVVNAALKLQPRNTDIKNTVGIMLLLLIPGWRCCIIYGV